MSNTAKKGLSTRTLVVTAMMIALTVIMAFTSFGTIRLPVVSITIAHLPAIIAAIVLGPVEGIIVAFAMGICSIIIAATSPSSILDPFFVNPLISVLPRVLIPITTRYSYKGLARLLNAVKRGEYIAIASGVVIGNLTNTFGVYTMLYLVYARQIFEKSGTPALALITAAISTTTLIKCVGVVALAVPVIYALNKISKRTVN